MSQIIQNKKEDAKYLVKYLLLANFIQFLEAGAVPALLISLSRDFELDHAQLGLLGGVIYIALSIGGPFAGYLLRQYEHKTVVGHAIVANAILTFIWASTPVSYTFSKALFILLRFFMGLAQCFLCVFLPLWINEYAPGNKRTSWMGYLQASVPLGIMTGYIIASIISDVSRGSETCLYIMCWRWPFFIEVALLVPLCVVLNSLPRAHFDLYTSKSLLERALPKTYVPSTCGTHKTGHNKSDSLNVIERAQDLHTDESYTPSSSSIRRSDQFESPDEINQSSTESHPILLHGTSGGYQELSPFPHRHSMESSDHPKSVNGSSPKSNYLPLQMEAYPNPKIERLDRHRLRQNAISASFYNANASKDMMRKSCDDLPSLDMSNDLVILISGIASTRGGDNAIEMGPELYWDAEEDERKAEGLLRLLDTSVSTFDLIPGSNDNTCAFVKDGSSLHFMNAPRNIFGRDRAASAPEEFEANARSPLLKVANQPSDYGSIPLSTSISEGANQSILAPAFQRGLSTGTQVSIESSGARRRSLSSTTPPAVTSLRSSRDNRASTSIKYESLRDASKKFAFKNTLSVVRQQMQMYLKGATSSAYQNINEATGTDPTSTGVNKVNPQNISNISPWRVVNSKNDPGVDDDSRDDESFNSILCDESEIATDDGSLSASVHKKQTHDQLSGTDIAISDKQKLNSLNVNPSRTHDILGQESGRIRLSESALKRIPSMQRFEQMNKSLREGLKGTIASSSDSESVSDDELEGLSGKIIRTEENKLLLTGSSIGGNQSIRTVTSIICALLHNKVYTYLVMAMAALYFVVTGVQFWGTSYLLLALQAPRPLVNSLFILCAASAPTSGVFFGGWAIDRCGGYKGAKQRVAALELCTIFGFMGCAFATPITFVGNIYEVVALLWLVLFFGAAVLPACSGIIVSIVPRHSRPVSSSLSLVIFNLFGYFLSLVLSGFLMQAFSHFQLGCEGACPLIWGFRIVLLWSYWALLFLLLALLTSYSIVREQQTAKRAAWERVVDEAGRGYSTMS